MVGYGLRVALDATIGLGEFGLAEAAGHFLLNLAHAQIALGAVIREGNARIPGEQQHGGFVLLQSLSQVMGVGHAAYNIGFGDAVALAVVPHQDGRPFVHPPARGSRGPGHVAAGARRHAQRAVGALWPRSLAEDTSVFLAGKADTPPPTGRTSAALPTCSRQQFSMWQ